MKKPFEVTKIAAHAGCQANRSFGIDGESFEYPMYLDELVENPGGESIETCVKKLQCCGGTLDYSEPDKSQDNIHGVIETAFDHGADMIVSPCALSQASVEI